MSRSSGESERVPVPWATGRPLHLPCAGCGFDLRAVSIKGICPGCGRPVASTVRVGGEEVEAEPDRRCRRCGYSLRGLDRLAPCPECGLEWRRSPANDAPLSAQPRDLIRRISWCLSIGSAALLAAWLGDVLALVAHHLLPAGEITAAIGQSGAVIAAAWILTIPVPGVGALTVAFDDDRVRLAGRWLSMGAALAPVLRALVGSTGWAGDALIGVAGVVGSIGLAALAWHVSGFAGWARDEGADRILRSGALLLLLAAALHVLAMLVELVTGPIGLVEFAALVRFAAVGIVVIGALRTMRSVVYCIVHARERELIDDARAERQRGEAAEARLRFEEAERVRRDRSP